MTVLGEAFIEVHGDLKPFIRDLDKNVKKAMETLEKRISKSVGDSLKVDKGIADALGNDIGEGIDRGVRRRVGDKSKSPWIQIAAALGSALDDGLSALPTEVKAAIVVGIAATVPLISAAIAGAAGAGLGLGLAVIGSIIATQFVEVQEAGSRAGNILRESLARAAEPFSGAIVRALNEIVEFFLTSEELFARIFDTASTFIGPLTDALLDSVESFALGIDGIDHKLGPFVDELGDGIRILTAAVTEAFEILVNTGEEGREGFRDLVFHVGVLIVSLARLVAIFTELYGIARDFTLLFPEFNPLGGLFLEMADDATNRTHRWSRAQLELAAATKATLAPTKDQQKAILDAAKAMDTARDAAFSLVDAEIAYQQSLDDLSATLKENGKTLKFETEEGRNNLRDLGDAIKAAQRRAEERLLSGKLTLEQAKALYKQEIDEIIRIGEAHGLTEQAIRDVYDEAIKLVNLPEPNTGWLAKIAVKAAEAAEALERAKRAAAGLANRGGKGTGGFTGFAEGGIVTEPTLATIAEGGRPEAVIPLTNPSRAAQLMQQSGLANMLNAAVTLVQVFLGTEQLDQRMYRVVQESNNGLANSVAFGARGL